MNILQVTSGRTVNGALVYTKLLAETLARRGHRVSVLCRPHSWMLDQQYENEIHVFQSTMDRFPLTELRRIAAWVRANEIDLIHTHMTRGHSFGVLLKMLTGVPVVATAHCRHFEVHWNFNNYVLANSIATEKYHRRVNLISESKMRTVYCCTDLNRFQHVDEQAAQSIRRQLRASSDDLVLGLVGEVVARKGHLYLFRALPKIMKAVPNLKLVMLGRFNKSDSYSRRLRQILIDNQLHGRTRWLGRRKNVEQYMAAFDFTVVPSLEEPLGLVAIESLAVGTPVIATNTGGLPEIVRHEQTGLLVPTRDSDALADAVIRLAADHQSRRCYGQRGRDFVMDTFAPERLVSQVEDVYSQVCDLPRAA